MKGILINHFYFFNFILAFAKKLRRATWKWLADSVSTQQSLMSYSLPVFLRLQYFMQVSKICLVQSSFGPFLYPVEMGGILMDSMSGPTSSEQANLRTFLTHLLSSLIDYFWLSPHQSGPTAWIMYFEGRAPAPV